MDISWFCREVLDLLKGHGRTLEASQKVTAFRDSHLEWEQVTIDFIMKLPRTTKGFDVIWMIVNYLTKNAHSLAIRESSLVEKLDDIYF